MTSPLTIRHDVDAQRFEATVDEHDAELDYRRSADDLVIVHTGVPPAIGGRGVGSTLVAAAVDYAEREGLAVDATCWFARQWLDEHAGRGIRGTAR